MAQAEQGQPAPDFTLLAADGEKVSLQQFRGKKVVLYFYPKDMTPSCTQEACDFRDYNSQIRELNAEVVGISPDDLKSHGKFSAKHELPFVLLSDPDHEVCELYGVWQLKKMYGKEYMGVVRSTFIIDENGMIARAWRKVRVKNHVNEVLEALKEL
ncbi:thioredoxin-dependent thiol peroxidase [Paenibacillus xerothermodurans]|uniref:thioredoxin-dependent peroxiredoxin n=1 Tax=Paenibacillus xerothermodurans TaxID=1977292 RepID=A0A2W1NA94_PAEXE|nr:thioredoxin-dependent thiol peroxidase [Paenibacillus xerothermodurans]PZE20844.1 thioredoxin-dependent thiol peroxidase [Paenibacillus xerothermodurans]